ncbi:MAG: hypothetical protein KDD52_03075 [Bdellovibrionales bacterium]|nr:hypothetical protein [Bdellovibrionales bacterium]
MRGFIDQRFFITTVTIACILACTLVQTLYASTSTALINGRETYITLDSGETQRYGTGEVIYVIDGSREKRSGIWYYRATLDPEDSVGIGWVMEGSVKVYSGLRAARKPNAEVLSPNRNQIQEDPAASAPIPEANSLSDLPAVKAQESDMTFLDQLIMEESQKDTPPLPSESPRNFGPTASPSPRTENPFADDLEFLFQDEEFASTLQDTERELSAKASQSSSGRNVFGISSFHNSGEKDPLVRGVSSYFSTQMSSRLPSGKTIEPVQHVEDIDQTSSIEKLLSTKQQGIFVGKLSAPLGNMRLLKVKYYDAELRKVTFEKVTKISQKGDYKKAVDELVKECIKSAQ